MKGKLLHLLWIAFTGICCAAQTMPYPVGYVYTTSVVDEDNLAITAATVSDTYGESGHTTSAVVKITSPDGRTAYGTGAWAYSSFASTGLSFCDSAGTCYDGLFIARSEGTQEYCPVTSTYLVGQESLRENQMQPYAYPKSARWVPSAVNYQSSQSDFIFTVGKTLDCPNGNVVVEMSILKSPSHIVANINPPLNTQRTLQIVGAELAVIWNLQVPGNNGTIGTIQGTGRLMGAPCRILPNAPQNSKDATLTLEAP